MHAKLLKSCPTLCNPVNSSPPGSSPQDPLGKNTEVGCHFLLHKYHLVPTVMYHSTLYLHKGYLDPPTQEHLIGYNKYTQAYKHEESTHERSVQTTFSGVRESQKTETLFLACIISEVWWIHYFLKKFKVEEMVQFDYNSMVHYCEEPRTGRCEKQRTWLVLEFGREQLHSLFNKEYFPLIGINHAHACMCVCVCVCVFVSRSI